MSTNACRKKDAGQAPDAGAQGRASQNAPHTSLPALPNKITAGRGFAQIQIGMAKKRLIDVLGSPSDAGPNLCFANKGIECALDDNIVSVIFFYYLSRGYHKFDGITDRGIGPASTVSDVIEKYGKPERQGVSIISEFGARPGAREVSLSYRRLGINFTFWDGELADIRVYRPH